jgi:hypothetical protein
MSTLDAERLVENLSYQDKERILANIVWEVFGEFQPDGTPILNPFKPLDKEDIRGIVHGLRRELFPGAKKKP